MIIFLNFARFEQAMMKLGGSIKTRDLGISIF